MSDLASTPSGAIPCVGCGYDLRAAAIDGLCPECGAPVQRAHSTHLLRDADVSWLRSLRLGVLLGIPATLCPMLRDWTVQFHLFYRNEPLQTSTINGLHWLGIISYIACILLETRPEPRLRLSQGERGELRRRGVAFRHAAAP